MTSKRLPALVVAAALAAVAALAQHDGKGSGVGGRYGKATESLPAPQK
ncbi:MAG TPA: hypothetical protein VIE64_04170 [Solirubrobacterales bacterium]